MTSWYHFDWNHIISSVALGFIIWFGKKLVFWCKLGVIELRNLASISDVKAAIDESNAKQLDRLRSEGLLNGVYVRNDDKHEELVRNVRRLIRAKGAKGKTVQIAGEISVEPS